MNAATAQHWLSGVTYMPGWEFTAYDTPHEGVWLSIDAVLPDAYHPSETTTLRIKTAVPPCWSRSDFLDWLLYRLGRVASHENREWLRVDGRPWSDPHTDDGGIPA